MSDMLYRQPMPAPEMEDEPLPIKIARLLGGFAADATKQRDPYHPKYEQGEYGYENGQPGIARNMGRFTRSMYGQPRPGNLDDAERLLRAGGGFGMGRYGELEVGAPPSASAMTQADADRLNAIEQLQKMQFARKNLGF